MSKKGLVNKYLYGKDNKTDFTDAMLPARRREQFGYLFKNNYLRLFYLNLIVFIFFLPAIIFYGMTSIYIYHLTSGIDNSQYITELLPISVFQYAGITLLLPIGFIGLSGTNFIIRKMAFDNLDDALCKILQDTLEYLKESDGEIDPATELTWNYYKKEMEGVS